VVARRGLRSSACTHPGQIRAGEQRIGACPELIGQVRNPISPVLAARAAARTEHAHEQDLVHHRCFARLRPQLDRGRPRGDIDTLKDLADKFGDGILLIALDVTDHAAVIAAVGQAHAHFGRLDVVVNNAGYGQFGFLEEITETEARAQIETNVFGARWVTQAAIPLMREQEVAPFGIKVTLIEPGGYATDWAGSSAIHSEPNPVYQPVRDARAKGRQGYQAPGPEATTAAVFAAVDAEDPPLRLLLSGGAYDVAQGVYQRRLQTWSEWEATSRSVDRGSPSRLVDRRFAG
jgi:NAD(P)-dependent dehydrogenase (short-subunit alcohol dehydrogenase family)